MLERMFEDVKQDAENDGELELKWRAEIALAAARNRTSGTRSARKLNKASIFVVTARPPIHPRSTREGYG